MGYSLARSTGISASYSICGRFAPRRPLCPSWTNDFTLELAPLRGRRSVPRFGLNLERNGWNFWRSERNQRSILFSILFFFERGGGVRVWHGVSNGYHIRRFSFTVKDDWRSSRVAGEPCRRNCIIGLYAFP